MAVPGVRSVDIDFDQQLVVVRHRPGVAVDDLVASVVKQGFKAWDSATERRPGTGGTLRSRP